MIYTLWSSFLFLSFILTVFNCLKSFLSLKYVIFWFNINAIIMMYWEFFMRFSCWRSLWFKWSWFMREFQISLNHRSVLLLRFLSSRDSRFWSSWFRLPDSNRIFIKVERLCCIIRWNLLCIHSYRFWLRIWNRIKCLIFWNFLRINHLRLFIFCENFLLETFH